MGNGNHHRGEHVRHASEIDEPVHIGRKAERLEAEQEVNVARGPATEAPKNIIPLKRQSGYSYMHPVILEPTDEQPDNVAPIRADVTPDMWQVAESQPAIPGQADEVPDNVVPLRPNAQDAPPQSTSSGLVAETQPPFEEDFRVAS